MCCVHGFVGVLVAACTAQRARAINAGPAPEAVVSRRGILSAFEGISTGREKSTQVARLAEHSACERRDVYIPATGLAPSKGCRGNPARFGVAR